MRILVVGDLHGNLPFALDYIFPVAATHEVDAIVQCGDFGYWEHTAEGEDFLDALAEEVDRTNIPLHWVRGNHDNLRLALARYGDRRTDDGFLACRPGVNLIPDGHIWLWSGKLLRAFGGARSLDRDMRLDMEAKRYRRAVIGEAARRAKGLPPRDVPTTTGTLWFPEEELTDDQYLEFLRKDSSPLDVVFSHDKPAGTAARGLNLNSEPEYFRNQQWLQRCLVAHRPQWWFHGHLHLRYTDTIRSGDDDTWTTVVGLGCDTAAADRFAKPWHTWCVVDLEPGRDIVVTSGS